MMNPAGYQETQPITKTCDQCSNPFPFVCPECAKDVYKAIHDDAATVGLTNALTTKGLSTGRTHALVVKPEPTGSFLPREVAQATAQIETKPRDPNLDVFQKLFIGSGEDAFAGCYGC